MATATLPRPTNVKRDPEIVKNVRMSALAIYVGSGEVTMPDRVGRYPLLPVDIAAIRKMAKKIKTLDHKVSMKVNGKNLDVTCSCGMYAVTQHPGMAGATPQRLAMIGYELWERHAFTGKTSIRDLQLDVQEEYAHFAKAKKRKLLLATFHKRNGSLTGEFAVCDGEEQAKLIWGPNVQVVKLFRSTDY